MTAMKTYSLAAFATLGALSCAVAAAAGCSSSSGAPTQLACNPCDGGGGGTQPTGHDTNPDGVAYPTPASGYGRSPRSGSTPGSVMQNFKFFGYPGGDVSKGLQTVALADFYDPCNKRAKLLHITVAAVWCQPCNQETDAIVAAKKSGDLASKGVVVLQALDDGPVQNQPATNTDLVHWIGSHQSNFTTVLDPGLANFAGFFDAAAVPWNADLDVRTMEIIDASVGWAGDVDTELQPALAALPANPSYPLPAGVTCP